MPNILFQHMKAHRKARRKLISKSRQITDYDHYVIVKSGHKKGTIHASRVNKGGEKGKG